MNERFGTMPDGQPVELVALRPGALRCELIIYGGAMRSPLSPFSWALSGE